MLGQVGVCEEDDVVVGARGGHRVPDDVERLLEVVGVDVDVEDAELVGLGDLRIGRQRRGELLAGLLVAWGPEVQHEHRDDESIGHVCRHRPSAERSQPPAAYRWMDAMPDRASIDLTLQTLARHPFRAKFHLRGRDAATVQLRGMEVIREHAAELLARRVAPAEPAKDGKQTPYRGHPVFVAQHATATCCRTCLQRWHGIPKGRELTADEQAYAVDVICRWIESNLAASGSRAPR